MARSCLIHVRPFDPTTNARIDVRMGYGFNSRTLTAANVAWSPAVVTAPKVSIDFLDLDMAGGLQVGAANFVFQPDRVAGLSLSLIPKLIWAGAPITIYSGDGKELSDLTVEFSGLVVGGSLDATSRRVSVTCEVNRRVIDVPLLQYEYGGGGGLDGDVEVRGQLKPACFGNPVNVPVFFFDQVNLVGQVDAYGSVNAIDALYEDAASFGPKVGDYANYATLIAATIPEGEWATCVAQGLVRLGAAPRGVITCDPQCDAGTPGTMALKFLENGGVTAGYIDSASFTALDATLTTILGHAPAVSYYTQSQVTVLDRLQALMASCNAVPLFMPQGKIAASRAISTAAATATINRYGGDALDWRSFAPPTPWWRLKAAAAVTFRVHQLSEIDYEDDLRDLGDHIPGEEYRQGNIVRLPADGRRYIYINATPSVNAPPNATYWDVYEEAVDAEVVRYVDGTPVQDLQPAEPGSNMSGAGINQVNDTNFLYWTLIGAARSRKNAIDGFALGNAPWFLQLDVTTSGESGEAPIMPVVGGKPHYFALYVQRNNLVQAGASLRASGTWLDAAGLPLSGTPAEMTPATTSNTSPGVAPVKFEWNQIAPVNAHFFRFKVWTPAVASGIATGAFRVENPTVSIVQPAADVTNENVAAGIDGQGDLATQDQVDYGTQVTGPDAPANNATQNGIGANELYDDSFLPSTWNLPVGAVRNPRGATSGFTIGYAPYHLDYTVPTSGAPAEANSYSRPIPVVPGRRLFMSVSIQKNAGVIDSTLFLYGIRWLDAAGIGLSNSDVLLTAASIPGVAAPKLFEVTGVAPAGAAYAIAVLAVGVTAGGGGKIRFERPVMSAIGQAAAVYGPNTKTVRYSYQGVALSGELPVDLPYSFTLNATPVTSGVTWTYTVLTGSVNGKTAANGAQAMTGAGGGTLTLSTIETDEATVRVTATASAGSASSTLTIKREFDAAPAGGGTGSIATGDVTGTTASSTFAAVTGTITGTMPAGKTTANITVPLTVNLQPNNAAGFVTVEFKLERNISGTWTQIGSVVTVNANENLVDSETNQYAVTPGNATLNIDNTGLTAGSTYDWRISARRTSGTRTAYLAGRVTVTAP